MKRLRYLIIPLIAVTAWSCSSQDEPQASDLIQEEEANVPAISQEEAVSVAMNAMTRFGYLSPSRAENISSDVEVSAYSAEKEDTAFYVVSYPEGGFVAVDANSEAVAKVLAISEKEKMSDVAIDYLRSSRPQRIAPGIIPDPVLPITPGNVSKVH